MPTSLLKAAAKTGLVTAVLILIYELSNQLLIYHYFKFEYYIGAVAIAALAAGIALTRRHYRTDRSAMRDKSRVSDLTGKELQVLGMISEGRSNKEIAALNFVEMSTVKTHINNIYAKLNVNNRRQATVIYQEYISAQKSTFSPPAAF